MRWVPPVLVATGFLGVLAWLNSEPSSNQQNQQVNKGEVVTAAIANDLKLAQYSNVDIDGGQHAQDLDENWLNADLRQLFDFFTALYEEGEQSMWLAFNRYCEPLSYCPELTFLFERYIEYKHRLATLDQGQLSLADEFEERLYQLADLQRDLFSQTEIDALFAHQRSWDEQAIARLKIRQDETLNAQQKAKLLEQHFVQLPEYMRPAVVPTMQLRQVSQLMDTGIDQGHYNSLAAEYGEDSAKRLIDLQRSKDDWAQRVEAFKLEKVRLAEVHGDNTFALNRELDMRQQQMFDANESKRLAVYLANPSLIDNANNNY